MPCGGQGRHGFLDQGREPALQIRKATENDKAEKGLIELCFREPTPAV